MTPTTVFALCKSRPLIAVWRRLPLLLAAALLAGCGHSHAPTRPASSLSEQDRSLLDQYEQIRAALADDNLRDARVAAGTMSLSLKPADDKAPKPPLYGPATQISTAPAIDRARQIFKQLSGLVIPMVDGVQGYYILTCDMPSCGDWVQRTAAVNNPYMGKVMRDYGQPKTGGK